MYAVVPRQKPTELELVQSGLLYLQTELTRGLVGNDLSKYQEVIRRADQKAILKFEHSEKYNDSWSSSNLPLATQVPLTLLGGFVGATVAAAAAPIQPSLNVGRCLAGFLPDPCMEVIRSGQITALQGIMDDRNVAVKDFLTLFGGAESDNKVVEKFCIMRLLDWNDTKLEVYYVKIEASFESVRALWMHEDKVKLHAEYEMRRYSASRGNLRSIAEAKDSYTIQQSIEEWLNEAITCQ